MWVTSFQFLLDGLQIWQNKRLLKNCQLLPFHWTSKCWISILGSRFHLIMRWVFLSTFYIREYGLGAKQPRQRLYWPHSCTVTIRRRLQCFSWMHCNGPASAASFHWQLLYTSVSSHQGGPMDTALIQCETGLAAAREASPEVCVPAKGVKSRTFGSRTNPSQLGPSKSREHLDRPSHLPVWKTVAQSLLNGYTQWGHCFTCMIKTNQTQSLMLYQTTALSKIFSHFVTFGQ
jgi:hypothetical protein